MGPDSDYNYCSSSSRHGDESRKLFCIITTSQLFLVFLSTIRLNAKQHTNWPTASRHTECRKASRNNRAKSTKSAKSNPACSWAAYNPNLVSVFFSSKYVDWGKYRLEKIFAQTTQVRRVFNYAICTGRKEKSVFLHISELLALMFYGNSRMIVRNKLLRFDGVIISTANWFRLDQ